MIRSDLPRPLVALGLAGLVPQAGCLVLGLMDGQWHWIGLAAGCFYAATILPFLGGLWWMAGLQAGERRGWLYGLAVLPSLASWLALMPWVFGWRWPGPSLAALGLLLIASPLADRAVARTADLPPAWLRLRQVLATGLGLLTWALAMT